jgi:hypothetical protein
MKQHAPEAALAHGGDRAPGEQERRAQIDRQHGVEGGGVDLLEAGDLAAAVIGHEHVDAAEDGLDLVDEAVGSVGVAEVGPEGRRLGQRRGQLLRRLRVGGVVQRERGARRREPLRDPAPDPAAGAGHERRSPFEAGHGCVAHCMMSNARAPRGPAS